MDIIRFYNFWPFSFFVLGIAKYFLLKPNRKDTHTCLIIKYNKIRAIQVH